MAITNTTLRLGFENLDISEEKLNLTGLNKIGDISLICRRGQRESINGFIESLSPEECEMVKMKINSRPFDNDILFEVVYVANNNQKVAAKKPEDYFGKMTLCNYTVPFAINSSDWVKRFVFRIIR